MTSATTEQQRKANPCAKTTYRVLNEPFKILGILDWRYALAALVPAVFFGLFAHSKIVGVVIFFLLAWQAYRITDEDPNLPLVLWLTITDKKHAGGFSREKKGGKR